MVLIADLVEKIDSYLYIGFIFHANSSTCELHLKLSILRAFVYRLARLPVILVL